MRNFRNFSWVRQVFGEGPAVTGLLKWLRGKESACQCWRCEFDPWVGKISWSRKCTPLQYCCLENPMDRGAWWAAAHSVAESDVLSD